MDDSKIFMFPDGGTKQTSDVNSLLPLDNMMNQYGVVLNNKDDVYDAVYIANMCKADFLGRSVVDDLHLCLYVKDVIDDIDGYEGIVFNRWYADMSHKGIPIDWYNYR